MPSSTNIEAATPPSDPAARFPPITRDHILNCSYDSWFPKYKASCIKSRIVPLSPEFIEYIREDGIILADEHHEQDDEEEEWNPAPSTFRPPPEEIGSDSELSDDEDDTPRLPPDQRFPELHQTIIDKIAELGGAVAPKLNWSSPTDATWISPHQNTVKCTTPNDIYLLLKSSNFITYDLEHAFDDCTSLAGSAPGQALTFKPVLVLRSFFNPHTAMEFRCFVKHRNLVGISQRDPNLYQFLLELKPHIISRISQLFNNKLRYTFPDGNFAFDVYIPEGDGEPLDRARLIDINPWAPHTDSLLFDWQELLDLIVLNPVLGVMDEQEVSEEKEGDSETSSDDDEGEDYEPDLRLIEKDDPSAYNFSSSRFSAHKLPKDVVDASMDGQGGMRDFVRKWREVTERR
ncbi:D123-domain-containing protein [Xylariaceae sp. FL1272]|nr:D123-domain-containing protein [Xylariaceae sp. FL1272]